MFGGQFLNARYVALSRRLINLAVYSESNDILSIRSYFQSKGGTFFETPGKLWRKTYLEVLFEAREKTTMHLPSNMQQTFKHKETKNKRTGT